MTAMGADAATAPPVVPNTPSPLASASPAGVGSPWGTTANSPRLGPAASTNSPGTAGSSPQLRMGPPVRFGTTDPISLQEASETDKVFSDKMLEELEAEFPAETAEGMTRRQGVLREIEHIFSEWAAGVAVESGLGALDSAQVRDAREAVKVTTLGSYRLGVVHPGSDIDTLCIAPPFVRREDFFSSLAQKFDQHRDVTECVPIPEAYTPIIKLKMRGVCIDLLFARLAKPLDPGSDLEEVAKADDVLNNMDEKSVRCINGFRVADHILQLVPNKDTFRQTLRFVKYWARRRGIYSNVLGFFGGITWSLLVARVCQLYPYLSPSQLINRFFRLYLQWNWTKPVMLCEVTEHLNDPGLAGLKVWNHKTSIADRQHVMPVITPAFPAMNSTYNVTETTKRILLEEFRRGLETLRLVEQGRVPWSKVYEPFPFFEQFQHFLWLEVLATNEDVYNKFNGWVESKLRILNMQLETVKGMLIHPNPLQYDLHNSDPDWPFGCGMFIALVFSKEAGAFAGQRVDLRGQISQLMEVINQWSEKDAFVGQHKLRVRRISQSDLPEYARPDDSAGMRKRKRTDNSGESTAKRAAP